MVRRPGPAAGPSRRVRRELSPRPARWRRRGPGSAAGRVPSWPGGDAQARRLSCGRARTRVNRSGAAGTRGAADTRGRGYARRSPPRAPRPAATLRRPSHAWTSAQGCPVPRPLRDPHRTPMDPHPPRHGESCAPTHGLPRGAPAASHRRPLPALPPAPPRRGAAEAAQAAQAEAAAPGLRCVAAAAAQHEWGASRADADRPRSRRPRSAARMRSPSGPGQGGACAGAGPARGGVGSCLQGALRPRRPPWPTAGFKGRRRHQELPWSPAPDAAAAEDGSPCQGSSGGPGRGRRAGLRAGRGTHWAGGHGAEPAGEGSTRSGESRRKVLRREAAGARGREEARWQKQPKGWGLA